MAKKKLVLNWASVARELEKAPQSSCVHTIAQVLWLGGYHRWTTLDVAPDGLTWTLRVFDECVEIRGGVKLDSVRWEENVYRIMQGLTTDEQMRLLETILRSLKIEAMASDGFYEMQIPETYSTRDRVRDLAEAWLDVHKLKETTHKQYLSCLSSLLKVLGSEKLIDLKVLELEKVLVNSSPSVLYVQNRFARACMDFMVSNGQLW